MGTATHQARRRRTPPPAVPVPVPEAASTWGRGGAGAQPPVSLTPLRGRRLGELLVDHAGISQAQLAEALLQQSASGKRIGTLLVELGALDERDLADVLAKQLGLPLVDLRRELPEAAALALLPDSVARELNAIPLRVDGSRLLVAVGDPSDQLRSTLAQATEMTVDLLVAASSAVHRAIDNSYRALVGVDEHVKAFEATDQLRKAAAAVKPASTSDDAPVVQVVNLLITQGLRDGASDIHVEPQDTRVRVRYRIDGALHDVLALPAEIGPALVSRIKIMAGMNIVERRRPQDGQIATEVDGRALDIRVSSNATIWGEKVVLRLLDKSRSLYRAGELGMAEDIHKTYAELIRSPFGMVLCAGPTGSGKTTTLYATLAEINNSERNIMTIEDPVEYIFASLNQIQINEVAGVTFAGGLKAILRQDPDVILVGEIRDVETARIAVQSALTGHFVLSSLHATDAASALQRVLDMGIESFLIASSVRAVVGQRLVRRICTSCATVYKPSPEELALFRAAGGSPTKRRFFHGEGCNFCAHTGYRDRIGVYELLRVTEGMKKLVVRHAPHDELHALAVEEGMRPLREEAVRLVTQDVTTMSEVIRTIYVV